MGTQKEMSLSFDVESLKIRSSTQNSFERELTEP